MNAKTSAISALYLSWSLYLQENLKLAYVILKQIPYALGTTPQIIEKSLTLRWNIINTLRPDDVLEKIRIQSQVIENTSSVDKIKRARQIVVALIKEKNILYNTRLTEELNFNSVKDLILYEQAIEQLESRKYGTALRLFRQALSYTINNTQIEAGAKLYIQSLEERVKVSSNTIGVILPLSGRHKRIGMRCLNGLQLGFGLYDSEISPFRLAVFDSKGKASSAREAVKTLFLKDKAIALVGGVVSESAVRIAEEAEKMMIPLISLSQKSGLTEAGSYIFQNAVTAKHIMEKLVTTLRKQGHSQFAILYPNDFYGTEHANLFWDYVEQSGGQITGAQTYKADEVDFNDNMRRLTGAYYLGDRDIEYRDSLRNIVIENKKRRQKINFFELLPPSVDFSVLFVPDSIKSISQIAPYIKFRNIENVILAGTSLWNSPKLLRKNKGRMEGAVFADALTTQHPNFKSSEFFETFKHVFGYEPGLFELLSYESALALRHGILSGNVSRDDLKDQLSQMKELASPVGQLQITESREFMRPIIDLTVQDGQILTLNP